jgi:predicted HicB family RNase H-like nuclease
MTQPPKPAARLTADLLVRKGEVHSEPPRKADDETLVQLTSRVKKSTIERLHEHAHKMRASKQELIETALREYLDRMGA